MKVLGGGRGSGPPFIAKDPETAGCLACWASWPVCHVTASEAGGTGGRYFFLPPDFVF